MDTMSLMVILVFAACYTGMGVMWLALYLGERNANRRVHDMDVIMRNRARLKSYVEAYL